jgi:branched-chain amino acid transport system substrate-binding protein
MTITRRTFTIGVATTAGVSHLAMPAIAQAEPIRIGWLAAMTGPRSAPAIGFDRGVRYAAETLNAAGGVKGRKVEIITRDTQGDPTKAVNATQELISSVKAHAIWGPTNSGESLAVTPIMARSKMPNIHPCVIDGLIDAAKFPNAYRISPSNTQWDDAVRKYCLEILKAKKLAVIGDTTGYGVAAAKASAEGIKKAGGEVVYLANIDATQPDMTPDLLRARNAGAEAIVCWSTSTGMDARLFNTRAAMGWDVAFVGHPSMSSGEIAKLVEKPDNWKKVYAVGYRSCSYDEAGNLPPRGRELVARLKGKVDLSDTLLWWVAGGIDAINLIAKAIEETGSSDSAAIIGYWNKLKNYPGYFGDYSYSETEHNGYPADGVVMSDASSAKDGAFKLAPGYKA